MPIRCERVANVKSASLVVNDVNNATARRVKASPSQQLQRKSDDASVARSDLETA
jgi:hypothetical protein